MVTEIYEVYVLNDCGRIIDHTPANHNELTFLDQDAAEAKARELAAEGDQVVIMKMGPV